MQFVGGSLKFFLQILLVWYILKFVHEHENWNSILNLTQSLKCFWLGHLAMLLLLNLIGRSETFAESDLREKITCLFVGIRVKLHFSFKGPLAIFF